MYGGIHMHTFTFKTQIHFETNALSRLSHLEYKKAFIIADPFTVSSGLIRFVTNQLDAGKVAYTIYSDVVPDPSVQKVVAGVTALVSEKAPCLIAVGGGSAIDLSKCVRQFAHKLYPDYTPHFIAIPTTSGTGSEVTSFAVITDTEKNIKHALVDDFLLPDEAILDVEMVKSVPPAITAETGMDVLTHAVEAYVSTEANAFSDMMAEKSAQRCRTFLFRSFKYPDNGDLKAREKMHLASNQAGIAFNSASLGLNHGMAHQLGAQFHISHGRANAILLPAIIEYNSGIHNKTVVIENPDPCIAKYARMAKAMGLQSYNDIASVKSLIYYTQCLRAEVKLPSCVREAAPSLTEAEYMSKIPAMVAAALKDRCTPTNPRVPTPEDVAYLFKSIW